ncbi:hypothetical protein Scep_025020 [Stephania cephalantha]|uniref:Uncharacterized protein n=1 Tax=Stephania cephalantha TaxID=152367 RepID=A0AAP0EXL9_9MAGN
MSHQEGEWRRRWRGAATPGKMQAWRSSGSRAVARSDRGADGGPRCNGEQRERDDAQGARGEREQLA